MKKILGNNTLVRMFKELDRVDYLYQPSLFWTRMNTRHNTQLITSGFQNFKRTINMKYFNWGIMGILRHQFHIVLKELMKGNLLPLFNAKFSNYKSNSNGLKSFNFVSAWLYKVYVASYSDYLNSINHLKILPSHKEPLIGNPFIIYYKGNRISQDLCNSIHEFYSIVNETKFFNKRIAELGAGYGRLAYVFLKMNKTSSYCIIDIPPALFVAQKYLSHVFPNKKIFHFRPFKSFLNIKNQFRSSQIQFIMPHQLRLIPKNYFNIFITISSLHEMSLDRISNYFKQANRVTDGYFYTKQWHRSRVGDNKLISEQEYPTPAGWQLVLKHSPHPVQRMFFDALYRTRSKL